MINAGKKILMSEQGRVDQVNSQGVIVGSPAVRMGSYKDGAIWSLASVSEADDNMPVFHIEQPYDLVRPRLVNIKQDNKRTNQLAVSCKLSDGHGDPKCAQWKILNHS